MSAVFVINRRGSRAKVKEALASDSVKPDGADKTQLNSVVEYLRAMIDSLPDTFNSVAVTANGELNDSRIALHSATVTGINLDI